MNDEKLFTEFAPAERETKNKIKDRYAQLLNLPEIKKLTDSIPDVLLILNDKR